MKYRIIMTIIAIVVFGYALYLGADDSPAPRNDPGFQVPPTNEPAMKGLQIN